MTAVTTLGQTSFSGTYTFTGSTGHTSSFAYNGTTIQNLTVSDLTKEGGSTSSSGGFRANNWPTTADINTGKYFELTITAATGYTISNPSLSFGIGRSGTGPRNFQWRSDVDNYASPMTVTNGSNTANVLTYSGSSNLNGLGVALTTSNKTSITFRFYGSLADASAGTGGLYGSLAFSGTLTAVPTAPSFTSGAATQTFTYGTAGTYNYTVTGMPVPTITTTLNPSGALPTGITAGTNSVIVAANTAPGTYDIKINASNTQGNVDKFVTLTINKANQTIGNFSNLTRTYGDPDFTLSATGGASGEPIIYTSSNTNVATISGNTVTIIGAGNTTITASQDYN